MAWKYVDFQAGRPEVGLGDCCPTPYPGCKPDEDAIFPGQSWPEYPNAPVKKRPVGNLD